jgi:hypothetical protein
MIAGRFGSSVFCFFEMICFYLTFESLETFLVNKFVLGSVNIDNLPSSGNSLHLKVTL